MSEYDALLSRRSIRRFKQGKVPDETVRKILIAGMAAPSAHNNQPWEFIVVHDRTTLMEMAKVCKYWTMLREADFAIAVVANLKQYKCEYRDFFIEDCSASTQNMLIAATGEGLGAVWLGCYPSGEYMAGLAPILEIQDDIIPFSIVALGCPGEQKPAHSEFYPNKVHSEKY